MDKELKNTLPNTNFPSMDFEKLYNDLLSNYEELKNRKIEIVAIKEDNIQKLTNKINKLETEIEVQKNHSKEMEKEYEEMKKQCVQIHLSKLEREAICEELEKKMNDITVKWQNININDIVEGSQIQMEKVKKCIYAYQNENGIFREKIDTLEDLIKNLESEKELLAMKLRSRRESENQSWFQFPKFFFFRKENMKDNQRENGFSENKCERSMEQNIAKLIITHNREKDFLTKKYKEKREQLEQDLEKLKKCCLDLQNEIKKWKNQCEEKNNEMMSIDKVEELQEQLKEKEDVIKNLKEDLKNYENDKEGLKRMNFLELENDQLVIKVNGHEEFIKTLEEKISTKEQMSRRFYETKSSSTEDYFEVDSEPLIFQTSIKSNEESYDKIDEVIDQEDYASCPLCSQVMLKTEIETHFAQCLENE